MHMAGRVLAEWPKSVNSRLRQSQREKVTGETIHLTKEYSCLSWKLVIILFLISFESLMKP